MTPVWPLLLALLACMGEPVADPTPTASARPMLLQPDEQLMRASMTLRGVRPSVGEIDQVVADPGTLDEIVDSYLDSPEFGETFKDMWAEILMVRADTEPALPAMRVLDYSSEDRIHDALAEAPLRLIEDIVVNDRPFTGIVTESGVFATQELVDVFGLYGWDPNGPDVQRLAWPDGREDAGVLSSAGMLRRHESAGTNFNRGRASVYAEALLCDHVNQRDVIIDASIDLSDEVAVAEAVGTLESCVGCHQSLDPLAAYFWGFKDSLRRSNVLHAYNLYDCGHSGGQPEDFNDPGDYCYPIRFFDASLENDWSEHGLRGPSFYGHEVPSLGRLGEAIAEDARFAQCMARRIGGYFLQVDAQDIPFDRVLEWEATFVQSGFSAKALSRAIVLSDPMMAAESEAVATGILTVRPEQYARLIAQQTGFAYIVVGGCDTEGCWDQVNLANTDLHGFRTISGGMDGMQVLRPVNTPTPTKLLAMSRIASEAAAYGVDQGRFSTPTEDDQIREQLTTLHREILGEVDPDIAETLALFTAARARHGDPEAAWKLTISALLQDVGVMFY